MVTTAIDYGVGSKLTLVGFNTEDVDGTDPLEAGTVTARLRWPGTVVTQGTFQEDYKFTPMRPVGHSQRSPFVVVKKGQHFEFEITSELNSFAEALELIAAVFGTFDPNTGIVTLDDTIPPLTVEYGLDTTNALFYVAKGCKIENIGFSVVEDDLLTMTVKLIARILDGDNIEPVRFGDGGFTSLDELVQFPFQPAHFKHNFVTVKFSFQKETLTIAGFEDGNYDVVINGTTFQDVASSETSEEAIRDALVIAINAGSEPVTASPGGPIGELIIDADTVSSFTVTTSAPGASTFTRVSSGTLLPLSPQPEIEAWDLSIQNTLIEKKTMQEQSHDVRVIIEDDQQITWSMTMVRENNDLLIISRQDPDQPEGLIFVEWVVDHIFGRAQNEGFFIKMTMDTCTLEKHELPFGREEDYAKQTFSGGVVGDPSLVQLKR